MLKEAQELSEPTELFFAQPLEDNIFEWHFTIRGPPDSDFDGGIYHGRILLPAEYPMKPPSIIMLTPNGRFKVNEKICLSISGHHPETWLPSWSIRTAMLALIGFMPTMGEGAIGSLDYTSDERKSLAKKSASFVCTICKTENSTILPILTEKSNNAREEAKELASQIQFKNSKPSTEDANKENTESSGLTRRNVENSSVSSDLNNLAENANTEPSSVNLIRNNSPSVSLNARQHQISIISGSRSENNQFVLLLMFIFSGLFLFLLLRRIYLILDNALFPI